MWTDSYTLPVHVLDFWQASGRTIEALCGTRPVAVFYHLLIQSACYAGVHG